MELHFLKHPGAPPPEFEKPIALSHDTDNLKFVCAQIKKAGDSFLEEATKLMNELTKKHEQSGQVLLMQLEAAVKEAGKWPSDFNKNRDELHIHGGIVYHTRRA